MNCREREMDKEKVLIEMIEFWALTHEFDYMQKNVNQYTSLKNWLLKTKKIDYNKYMLTHQIHTGHIHVFHDDIL